MKNVICIFWLAAVVSCATTQNTNTPRRQQSGSAIAFNVAVKDSSGNSNYEVFTMNTDGTEPKNITNHKDVAWTYRAYKNTLYFISDRDTCYRCFFLYQTDVNGKHIKRVSNLQLEDSWMDTRNNGTEMIVAGRIGKEIRYQLFLINTVDGTFRQLTHDTAAYYRDPAFSPDGRQIAFVYRKNKRDRSLHDEIFVMNADGTEMRQLTYYPKDNISFKSNGYKAGATHWHPTENFISYISMQNGQHNIFAVSPDGKKQWKLTEHRFAEGWHDWSADGNWLIFDTSNETESQYHIMIMNWKTGEVKQLTDTKYKFQQAPVFVGK